MERHQLVLRRILQARLANKENGSDSRFILCLLGDDFTAGRLRLGLCTNM